MSSTTKTKEARQKEPDLQAVADNNHHRRASTVTAFSSRVLAMKSKLEFLVREDESKGYTNQPGTSINELALQDTIEDLERNKSQSEEIGEI